MKLIGFLFCFFLSATSFAFEPYYEINMDLSVSGKVVSSPRVVVLPGEYATITQTSASGEMRFGLVANEAVLAGKEMIQMNLEFESLDPQGKEIFQGTAEIYTNDGESSYIRARDEKGEEIFSLYLTATRETL